MLPPCPRRRFLALAGIATGTALGSTPVASASETIEYGDTVSGTTDGHHQFTSDGGDVVSIDLRVDNEYQNEGYLRIWDPNGDSVRTRWGNGYEGNAVITGTTLPGIEGTYTIEVSAGTNSDSETFGYTLSLYEDIPIDETIEYGDTVSGELDETDRYLESNFNGYHETYSFEGSEGDVVSIEMRPEDKYANDADLNLYDPNDERIAYTSTFDGDEGNMVISREELPQDGEYTIVATSSNDDETFAYDLSLYEGIPIDQEIGYGDTVDGALDERDRYLRSNFNGYHETYSFAGEEGDVVSVEMRPEDKITDDAYLNLYDPNHERIAYESSSGDEGNTVISRAEIEQDGEYTIVATSSLSTDLFSYGLSLYEGIPIDDEIEYGETIEGELAESDRYLHGNFNGYHETYAFDGEEGDVVSVEMRPEDKTADDAYLNLYDPNHERIAYGLTSYGDEGNTVISGAELEQDGEYTIVATSSDYSGTFSYDLSLYEGIPIDGEIGYGDTVEGELDETDRYLENFEFSGYHETYAFDGAEGDVVSVEMRPEDKTANDAQLTLYGPNHERITSESSDGDEGNTVISRGELEQDGEYIIVATSSDDDETFSYDLSLYEGIPIDEVIGYGETIESALSEDDRYLDDFDFNGYHETYAFDGAEGDVVSVEMRPEDNSEQEALLALFDPSDELLTSQTSGDGGNATLSLGELSRTGEYTVVAMSDEIDETFSYDLSLYEGIPIDETIEYGDVVDRELDEDDRYLDDFDFRGYHDTYALEAVEGDVVSVEMRPEDEYENDAMLALFDPSDERVTHQRTGREGFATIELEELDRSGEHTIVATSSNDDETFSYELRVHEGIPSTDRIAAGETLTGSITVDGYYLSNFDGFYRTYTFGAREDDEVTIEARPPELYETEMTLRLYDESTDRIAWDTVPDDDGIASIETTIERPGEYTIVVAAGDSTTVDGYQLSMDGATDLQPPAVVGSDPPQDLDGDGLYEDVTGDGTFTAADVHALYEHRDSDVVVEHPAAFDFSGTGGEVTVADVQALWNRLTENR
ncbi:hypothetical protein [Natronoglomus mannanivorans]|uniref:Pre-peptidase C-terminal domain-containing protein n=1 Tax=Natronoglomus mannanivorans TaxID=2979990 RepID=A0AAP2Z1Q7_9EURY|nr:hypothetical protein [Halobacteria archaeon AArc-xg1-1]